MSEQLIFRDRRGTNAMKWNYLDRIGFKGENLLGMSGYSATTPRRKNTTRPLSRGKRSVTDWK